MSELHGDEDIVEPTARDCELALEVIVDEVMAFGRYPRNGRAVLFLYDFVEENCDSDYVLETCVGALMDDRSCDFRGMLDRNRENIRGMLAQNLKGSATVINLAVEFLLERRDELS